MNFFHVIHEGETVVLTERLALSLGGTRDMPGLCGVIEQGNEVFAVSCGTATVVSLR